MMVVNLITAQIPNNIDMKQASESIHTIGDCKSLITLDSNIYCDKKN